MKGFKQYSSLVGIHYEVPELDPEPKKDVKSPADHVLDLIFSCDKHGWPNTSVEVMLSSKTSDEVRQFITDHLLGARDSAYLIKDSKIINEYQNLESDFIARCSRNRFESIEAYENRLQEIINDSNLMDSINRFHSLIRNNEL